MTSYLNGHYFLLLWIIIIIIDISHISHNGPCYLYHLHNNDHNTLQKYLESESQDSPLVVVGVGGCSHVSDG